MNKIKEFIEAILYLPSLLKMAKNESRSKQKDDISRIPKGLTEWRPRRK